MAWPQYIRRVFLGIRFTCTEATPIGLMWLTIDGASDSGQWLVPNHCLQVAIHTESIYWMLTVQPRVSVQTDTAGTVDRRLGLTD